MDFDLARTEKTRLNRGPRVKGSLFKTSNGSFTILPLNNDSLANHCRSTKSKELRLRFSLNQIAFGLNDIEKLGFTHQGK